MIVIRMRPVTILAYFFMFELGRSMSMTVAKRMNTMMFVIHSVKNDIGDPPFESCYRTIMVMFPAATMMVMLRKNMNDTMARAAKT